jgi:two-component system, NarL family, sensor histidine kinase UhpB
MRNHPARGMYDQLEDTLTSMTMQLRSAIAADAQPPQASGRARGWARQVSAELASVLLDTLGLAATIEWHVRQYQKCTGILCELTVSSVAGFDLPEDYAATIYDIYNEALSNVARHAGASRVVIGLTVTPHEVTMVVSDNGIGLRSEATAADASGIAAIRERSKAYAGSCEFAGARNAGTTVTVSLPIAQAAR